MNRLLWLLLNCVLIATAYAVTMWVLNQVPAAPAASDQTVTEGEAGERGEDRRAAKRPGDSASRLPGARPEELAVLWRETLFRPDRSEELAAEPTEEEAVQDQPFNLELIGLAQIGERAIAVIVEHRASVPRPRVPARAALLRNRPPPAPGAVVEEAVSPDRHVYAVDDEIGGSGYTVQEIRLDEEEVVIVRGNEERVLNLDKGDDQSSSRLKTAADAAASREARVAAKSAAEAAAGASDAATPPAPPPPPVAAAGKGPDTKAAAGGTAATPPKPVTQMTREERLERARLLRERILQRRAQSNRD